MRTLFISLLVFGIKAGACANSNSCPEPASNTIFVELGGNGVSLSINYEKLLTNNFAMRLGVGALYGVGTSIPLMANFYLGEKYKLELGAGLVFLPLWKSDASSGKRSRYSFLQQLASYFSLVTVE